MKNSYVEERMSYRDALFWVMGGFGYMAARKDWHTEDVIEHDEKGVEIWTPKCILLNKAHCLELQVGDIVTPYTPSKEDEEATDWIRI